MTVARYRKEKTVSWGRVAVIVALIIGVAAVGLARDELGVRLSSLWKPAPTSIEYLTQVAAKLDDQLPMDLDDETVLFDIGAEEGRLIYSHQLPTFRPSVDDADLLLDLLNSEMLRTGCRDVRLRSEFLDQGVAVRYVYYDKFMQEIGRVELTEHRCNTEKPKYAPL